jgi:hypothetical protein
VQDAKEEAPSSNRYTNWAISEFADDYIRSWDGPFLLYSNRPMHTLPRVTQFESINMHASRVPYHDMQHFEFLHLEVGSTNHEVLRRFQSVRGQNQGSRARGTLVSSLNGCVAPENCQKLGPREASEASTDSFPVCVTLSPSPLP